MTGSALFKGLLARDTATQTRYPDPKWNEGRAIGAPFILSGLSRAFILSGNVSRIGNRTTSNALSMQNTHHFNFPNRKEYIMLGWALTFLVVALIAGALGFGGIAGTSAGIAKVLFIIFIVLFIVAMIARAVRGRPPI